MDGVAIVTETENITANFAGGGPGSWIDTYWSLFAAGCVFKTVSVQLIHPTRYYKATASVAKAPNAGQVCDTPNIAAVITKKTTLGARKGIGATHIRWVPADAYSAGLLEAPYKAGLVTFTALMEEIQFNALTGTGWRPIVLNKELIPGSTPPKYRIVGGTPITSTMVQDQVRVMRRRTVGLGI